MTFFLTTERLGFRRWESSDTDLAFSHLGFRALYAGHHPENIASAHILSVLGFTRTGAELYHSIGLMHPTCILTKEAYLRIRNTQG